MTMDVLGNLLEPYRNRLATLAGTVTCLQFLSGIFLVKALRKTGNIEHCPPGPIIVGLVLTSLGLKMGDFIGDAVMINVNIIGFAINAMILMAFLWYAPSAFRAQICMKAALATAFTMLCLAYAKFEDPKLLEFRFGMLITTILVILVGSPLLNLGEIVKKKSTEGMPFPIILSGAFVSASWILYGFSIKNNMLIYQNAFLFGLGFVQLMLFVIYPQPLKGDPSSTTAKRMDVLKERNENRSHMNLTTSVAAFHSTGSIDKKTE